MPSCSSCLRVLSEPFFLRHANAAPGSRIYKTCYVCRARITEAQQRRIQKRAPQERISTPPPPLSLLGPRTPRTPRTPRRSPQIQAVNGQPLPQYAPERPVALQPGFLPSSQWDMVQEFNTHMASITMDTCDRRKERWFNMKLKLGICYRCLQRHKGGQSPFLMSAVNELDPGDVPAYLPELSQVEEMIIARSHVQLMVTRYRGHQYHYTGHCQAPIATQGILTSSMAGPSTFPPGSANPFAGPADRPAEIARL
jgi:hypothetical protein